MKKPYEKPTLTRLQPDRVPDRNEQGLDSFAEAKITAIELGLDPDSSEVEFTFWFEHTGTEPFDKSEFEPGSDTYERLDYMEAKLMEALVLTGEKS